MMDPWNMPWMETAKSVGEDPINGFNKDWLVVSDKVEISVPAQLIWDILIDLKNYNRWNPFCVMAESTLEMGAPVYMQLVSQTMPGELQPNLEYVCEKQEPNLLSWGAKWVDEFPYPARRDQIIEETGPESCTYVSSDAFLGEHGWHVMTFCGPWVQRCFTNTAVALKAYAEAKHRGELG
jgi:hypothetical protein